MPTPQPVSGSAWPDDLAGVRIAYSPDLGFGTNSTDVQRHTDAAAEVLRGLGATVEPVDLGWSDPAWAYHILWFSGAAKVLRPFVLEALGKIDPAWRRQGPPPRVHPRLTT